MKTYFKEIIDLGHEYYNDMPNLGANHCAFWPLETFEHTRKISGGKLATEGKMILMAEHCGTHIDAPRHFDEHGKTVDEVPLDPEHAAATSVAATESIQHRADRVVQSMIIAPRLRGSASGPAPYRRRRRRR